MSEIKQLALDLCVTILLIMSEGIFRKKTSSTYLIINSTIPQKQIRTANTDKMFDSSATDTSIAVIATSILSV